MKRLMKYLGLVIAIVLGLGYLVVNHSIADETKLVCKGKFFTGGKALDEEDIFFKFQKFRWWVHLWSDSDGVGFVELKGGILDNLENLEILRGWGDIVFDRAGGAKKGRYSGMSRTMRYVYGGKPFEGKCIDRK